MAQKRTRKIRKWNARDITLVAMASLSVVFLAVFSYAPLFGLSLAFKDGDYKLNLLNAITMTEWVGFDNFKEFLQDPNFVDAIKNTVGLNLIML